MLVVVFGGVLLKVSLSIDWLQHVLSFNPPPMSNLHLFILTLAVLILTPLLGQLWCAHLCPFGALQELISRLGMTLGVTRERKSLWIKMLRGIRYVMLMIVLLSLYSSNPQNLSSVDPMSSTFSTSITGLALIISVLASIGALFEFRFYCRNLCPVGALLSILSKPSLLFNLKPKRDYSKCDLNVKGVWDTDCLQCNRCIRELNHPDT